MLKPIPGQECLALYRDLINHYTSIMMLKIKVQGNQKSVSSQIIYGLKDFDTLLEKIDRDLGLFSSKIPSEGNSVFCDCMEMLAFLKMQTLLMKEVKQKKNDRERKQKERKNNALK